jgi:hypothetical protein
MTLFLFKNNVKLCLIKRVYDKDFGLCDHGRCYMLFLTCSPCVVVIVCENQALNLALRIRQHALILRRNLYYWVRLV